MKKKLLISCLLLVAVMVLSCVAVLSVGAEETMAMADVAAQAAVPAAGDTVTISDEAELKAFSAYVSAGGATEGITFRLENDIALEIVNNENTTNFNPIGGVYNTSSAAPVAFLGTFDGNGKTVSGLIFTDMYVQADGTAVSIGANSANLGFFSLLGEGAIVKDLSLTVKAAKDIGGDYFGVLASKAVGASIISCNVNGEGTNNQLYSFLDGTLGVAGLVGYAEGSVIDGCKVNVKVNGAGASAAGVVAVAKDTDIRNCVASGTYMHTTQGAVGGVVAKLEGSSVKNCYSSATLTTNLNKSTEYLGGIAGQVDDTSVVENCFSDAILSTTKKNPKLGSLVGLNEGVVKHSFALRDPKLDGTETNHSDIGKNNGTKVDVSPYQPKTENGETVFLLGTISDSTGSVPCEYCYGDGCDACGWEGYIESTVYSFVPAASGSTSLVDALNAWCDENAVTDSVNYIKWSVSGSNSICGSCGRAPVFNRCSSMLPRVWMRCPCVL